MRIFLPFLLIAVMFDGGSQAYGLELTSAFDDGFTVPSPGRMAEGSFLYPGAESFANGPFGALGWSIPFGMDDMALTTVHGGYGFGRTAVSASFTSMGFDLYGEESGKIGVAYAPLRMVAFGARITRQAMRIKGFGDAPAFGADIGAVFRPHPTAVIAVSMEDIGGAELGESKEPVDGHFRLSGSWKATTRFTLLASTVRTQGIDTSTTAGIIADLPGRLVFGVLGGTEPDRFEFLGGLTVSGINFCYRGSHHRDLGMTHGWSIGLGGTSRQHDSPAPARHGHAMP